jgi:hypothetical protein
MIGVGRDIGKFGGVCEGEGTSVREEVGWGDVEGRKVVWLDCGG